MGLGDALVVLAISWYVGYVDYDNFDLTSANSMLIQRDEDFDTSYESLLSLAATLGDAHPRFTPDDVIASLPTAPYSE